MQLDQHTMTIGDVARALGLSVERIRQLDGKLKPTRQANGQRRYDPRDVEVFERGRR